MPKRKPRIHIPNKKERARYSVKEDKKRLSKRKPGSPKRVKSGANKGKVLREKRSNRTDRNKRTRL